MIVLSFSDVAAARPKKINIYFLCSPEPNFVGLWADDRRPHGPSAPRGAHRCD